MQPDVILGLVTSLRQLSPEHLRDIATISEFSLRRMPDLYHVAEAALTPSALELRLTRLDARLLDIVANSVPTTHGTPDTTGTQGAPALSSEDCTALRNLAMTYLVDGIDTVLPEAAARARTLPRTHLKQRPKSVVLTPQRALQLTDELLLSLEDGPLPLSRAGTVSVASTRQLHDQFDVPSATIDALASLLTASGLVTSTAHALTLVTTEVETRWLHTTAAARFNMLAAAWAASLPTALRAEIESPHTDDASLTDRVTTTYPLASTWRTRLVNRTVQTAAALGSAETAPQPLASCPEIAEVIIQPDGSVIAPGLLAPAARRVVATFASVEHVDVATTFRIDSTAIATALSRRAGALDTGAIAAASTVLLDDITAHTPTPPPDGLRRLIERTARQLSEITITERPGGSAPGSGTQIKTATPALANELQSDRLLSECQLQRDDDTSISTVRPPHAIRNILVERRYLPAIREQRQTPSNSVGAHDDSSVDEVLDRAHELIAHAEETNTLEGRLQLAMRYRFATSITVTGRRGDEHTWLVRPLSLAHGRLVAADDEAEVERTIPLDRILRVVPLEQHQPLNRHQLKTTEASA